MRMKRRKRRMTRGGKKLNTCNEWSNRVNFLSVSLSLSLFLSSLSLRQNLKRKRRNGKRMKEEKVIKNKG